MAANHTEHFYGDDLIVGLVYLLCSLTCIAAYIPCLFIMATDRSVRHLSCYKLMFHYGIADIMQLTGHAIAGLVTATHIDIPYKLNKVFGGLTNCGWMAYTMLAVVVAIDRYVHVCKTNLKDTLFGATQVKIWIGVCWLVGFSWLVVYVSPYVSFIYFSEKYAFYYDYTRSYSGFAQTFGLWVNTTQMILMSACYLVILASIRIQTPLALTQAQLRIQRRERSLMVQVALICLYILLFELFWDLSPSLMPDSKYSLALGNLLWIFNGGINPLVYLTLNQTMRSSLQQALGFKSSSETTSVLQQVYQAKRLLSADPSPLLTENEEGDEEEEEV